MTDEIEMVKHEYELAIKKYPIFANAVYGSDSVPVANRLCAARHTLCHQQNVNHITADKVLECELLEASDAYLSGDKTHAIQELAQCGAVILRMMAMIKKECTDNG